MSAQAAEAQSPAPNVCAIYTRKSTSEGLEQEFNTLHHQREACENYIKSQPGWTALSTRYDDGGFTGANADRPGLKQLLEDVKSGHIKTVVVYKVDRLSRSILDFQNLWHLFKQHGVNFVSITQSFNTASSLGELMLNILLAFAQFEREQIAERTRDKMGAARRKGRWTGGHPPFGYDVHPDGGRLTVNEAEAAVVTRIHQTYLRTKSVLEVVGELNREGLRTKTWTKRDGLTRIGKRWAPSSVRRVLKNRTYLGLTLYKGDEYPGDHDAILDPNQFRQVQQLLASRSTPTATRNRGRAKGFALRGILLCAGCGQPMRTETARRKTGTHRYYRCKRRIQEGAAACPGGRVPARELDRFVAQKARDLLSDQIATREIIEEYRKDQTDRLKQAKDALRLVQSRQDALLAERRETMEKAATTNGEQGQQHNVRLERLDTELGRVNKEVAWRTNELEIEKSMGADSAAVVAAVEDLQVSWESLTHEELGALLSVVIDVVIYDAKNSDVTIEYDADALAIFGEGS